ncbi:endonuclease [Arcobacter sp. CECT 8983]|uniref:endonuclease/exonuclease/phosphatase family protein n=1 Tax=Arcobacter sp. CECT 8983 TaxID=2044508 RepID=UPI00100ADC6F|nr:endonuclease/exonuclease/phosphatase family protein [Arcobacter sp. CECT 8983]RXJ88866.1 endonuclease [Arcobacter sp. CECT 8983]
MIDVEITFLLILFFLLIATLLPLLQHRHWTVRFWEFPRLILIFSSFILLCTEIIFLDLSKELSIFLIIVTSAILLYQTIYIVPYTIFYPKEVENTTERNNLIKIMTANVLMHNKNTKKFIELINKYDPDIIITLETNKWWEEELASIESKYIYNVKCPLDNLYGMHLYSKFKIEFSEIKYLVEDKVPSIHSEIILPSKQKIKAYFLHPKPPSPTENEKSTNRDVELIILAKSLNEKELPVIVTGDLNDVAWSRSTKTFKKISKLLDPRVGRGIYNTYNAKYWFFRWPLDHLFHSKHFKVNKIERLPYYGSDHFAILTSLELSTLQKKEITTNEY